MVRDVGVRDGLSSRHETGSVLARHVEYVESRRVVYRVVVMFGNVPARSCSGVLCRAGVSGEGSDGRHV